MVVTGLDIVVYNAVEDKQVPALLLRIALELRAKGDRISQRMAEEIERANVVIVELNGIVTLGR